MGHSSAVWSHDIRYRLYQDIRYTMSWVEFRAREVRDDALGEDGYG
jgi:hypothetical protein